MVKLFLSVLISLFISLTFISFGLSVAFATNGANFIGFSSASTGMGGADLVAIADTSAINNNPASLSLINRLKYDLTFSFIQPYLHHKDTAGVVINDTDGENNPFLLADLGLASRFKSLPRLTWGIGIFSQGGFGTDFRDLNTAFGTKDNASSFLRYTKLAAAISYQVSDKLSIGVAPHIGYSDVSLRFFPGTSSPGPDGTPGTADDFAGIEIKDRCSDNLGAGGDFFSTCPWDTVFGVKVGVLYEVSKMVSVGAAYTSPVKFNYDNGEIIFNFSDLGLGNVTYDARVEGFKWPQQVDFGIAVRPSDRLLLALDTSWINWNIVDTITAKASNPSNPLALLVIPSPSLSLPLNWKDQWVVAFGAAYEVMKERLTLRAGYNFGNNPVPNENLSPLVQVIMEHHITAGIGYKIAKSWSFDTSFVYALENRVTYTNPTVPFGTNAVESPNGFSVDATIGYGF